MPAPEHIRLPTLFDVPGLLPPADPVPFELMDLWVEAGAELAAAWSFVCPRPF